MLVSIITSVYNCQDYVGEMLNSLIDQTFQEWECIIIDDASTDNTWGVIERYSDKRIIPIRNKENMGLTRNLNKGIERAKGKYLIRIDGDDKAYPSRIEKQVQFMEDNPQVVVSGSYMQNFGQRYEVYKALLENDRLRVNMLFNSVIYHPTFIIRKEVLDMFHIRYDESFRFAQDYNLLYQLMQHGELGNFPESLMKWRVHEKQIEQTWNEQQRKCADRTRRLMLKLLDIELTEAEEHCWFRWCLDNKYGSTDIERETIRLIQERILDQNMKKKVFDQSILEEILKERTISQSVAEKQDADRERDKYWTLFLMMNQWVKVKQEGKNVAEYLNRAGYRKIAIYGLGYAGETLLSELRDTDIEIAYLIDRNAKNLYFSYPIVTPDEAREKVDAIIVTAVTFYNEIQEKLSSQIESPIVSFGEILFDM